MLIAKSIRIAIDHEVLKSETIIVYAKHTVSRFNKKSLVEILRNHSKKLRKVAYGLDENLKTNLPTKSTINNLETEKVYTQEVIEAIEKQPLLPHYPIYFQELHKYRQRYAQNKDLSEFLNPVNTKYFQ